MRFVPTVVHGLADYIVGLIAISLPFIFGWVDGTRWAFVLLGMSVVVYSLFTDYELGVVGVLRMRVHLALDAVFGVLMLAMPWFLVLEQTHRWPVYLLGILSLIFATTTKLDDEATHAED